MPFIPQCKWYMDIDIKDNEVFPRATMICMNTCMACGKYEGYPERTYINTLSNYPSYTFVTCNSRECAKKVMKGMAHFYKTYGQYIMLFSQDLGDDCIVVRTSGDVESGWSIKGFYTSEEGVDKIFVSNMEKGISKAVPYDDFIKLNPSKEKQLALEINSYFMSVHNRLMDMIHVNRDSEGMISISN